MILLRPLAHGAVPGFLDEIVSILGSLVFLFILIRLIFFDGKNKKADSSKKSQPARAEDAAPEDDPPPPAN